MGFITIFYPAWGKGGKEEVSETNPSPSTILFPLLPSLCQCGPPALLMPIPAPWLPLHPSCQSPDPSPALPSPTQHASPKSEHVQGKVTQVSQCQAPRSDIFTRQSSGEPCQHLPTASSPCEEHSAEQALVREFLVQALGFTVGSAHSATAQCSSTNRAIPSQQGGVPKGDKPNSLHTTVHTEPPNSSISEKSAVIIFNQVN